MQDMWLKVFSLVHSKTAITDIICLKNLIKCYQITYDSELDTTFVVHHSAFGLPDLLFEMHPCGLHICYPKPKKICEFRFVQTVEVNMKLFSKRQIAGAVRARHLYKKLIYPSSGVGCRNHQGRQGRRCNLGPICSHDEREQCEKEPQGRVAEYCQGSQGAHKAPTGCWIGDWLFLCQ